MGSHRAARKPSRSHARPKGAPRARGIVLALGAITVAAGAGVTAFSGGDQGQADRVSADGADTASGSADEVAGGVATPLASPSATRSASPSPSHSPLPAKPAKSEKSASPSASAERSAAAERAASRDRSTPTNTPATTARTSQAGGDSAPSGAEAQVLALVNKERSAAGCGPVTANDRLTQAADDYSDVMADSGVMSHTGPDGSTMTSRVEAAGYAWSTLGENIAQGQPDAASVMDAWMNSPGHRANILNCSFEELGVGVHVGDGGPWWTQNFGASR
ncbi:CAP domain-containing protein [Streptomyces sp. PKU-EA00015]|uniref:CAP domain-containing protein n=1 Tax=Streptomyces sp. PKU-EA00015 TaxID=2748326 RepID=UPI0015A194B1|nr:CAP domain-containing protein [Streptomyces sp. PKU-EA00015]NWF26578.1 CAP domain-containing protein [Streptomyces sp. PKU-EA00015]